MRRVLRIAGRVLLLILVCALAYLLYWLQPQSATDPALAATRSGNGVTVTTTNDLISFLPTTPATTGVIFYPGALVDPVAYAYYMRTYAEHDYAAFILKVPFDVSFPGNNQAEEVISEHPAIKNWIVGGHSLGGVTACSFAASHANQLKGILLFASWPANNIASQISRLAVLSISGSNDGLATPDQIQASKALLPSNTQFVVIQGSVHSFFGEYGHQPGDGNPTISRADARNQIIQTSLGFLQRIALS